MGSKSVDAWLKAQRKAALPRTVQELSVWQKFLELPFDEAQVARYAEIIGTPYIKPIADTRIEVLWSMFVDAVEMMTDQNDKLAELLIQLQRLPGGVGILDDKPWWRSLPYFNQYWSEWVDLNGMSPSVLQRHHFFYPNLGLLVGSPDQPRDAYINHQMFLSKVAAKANGIEVLDQTFRGSLTIRRALEYTPWDKGSPTFDKGGQSLSSPSRTYSCRGTMDSELLRGSICKVCRRWADGSRIEARRD